MALLRYIFIELSTWALTTVIYQVVKSEKLLSQFLMATDGLNMFTDWPFWYQARKFGPRVLNIFVYAVNISIQTEIYMMLKFFYIH